MRVTTVSAAILSLVVMATAQAGCIPCGTLTATEGIPGLPVQPVNMGAPCAEGTHCEIGGTGDFGTIVAYNIGVSLYLPVALSTISYMLLT